MSHFSQLPKRQLQTHTFYSHDYPGWLTSNFLVSGIVSIVFFIVRTSSKGLRACLSYLMHEILPLMTALIISFDGRSPISSLIRFEGSSLFLFQKITPSRLNKTAGVSFLGGVNGSSGGRGYDFCRLIALRLWFMTVAQFSLQAQR